MPSTRSGSCSLQPCASYSRGLSQVTHSLRNNKPLTSFSSWTQTCRAKFIFPLDGRQFVTVTSTQRTFESIKRILSFRVGSRIVYDYSTSLLLYTKYRRHIVPYFPIFHLTLSIVPSVTIINRVQLFRR